MFLRPHPEEPRSGVSKDGRKHRRCIHPSRRIACAMLLRMRTVFAEAVRAATVRAAGTTVILRESGDPVRRDLSIKSLTPLEYWVARSTPSCGRLCRAMTPENAAQRAGAHNHKGRVLINRA